MNEMQIFSNKDFGEIRTVMIDGEPWFVGSDVARALCYSNVSDAVNNHCKHGKMEWGSDSLGRRQQFKIVPEGDMYRLIVKAATQGNSEIVKEAAERFEKWIFDEVLPTLRKTGTYTMPQKQDSYMIEDPVERAKRWIEEQEEKKLLESKNAELEIRNKEMSPKAMVYDQMIDSRLLVNFRDAAKEIGISQSQFTGWLKDKGYVYSNNAGELRPMEAYMESGLFEMKPYQNPHNGYAGSRTYITPRGLAAFKIILEEARHNRYTMQKHGGRNGKKR